jgi:hypothetical protein
MKILTRKHEIFDQKNAQFSKSNFIHKCEFDQIRHSNLRFQIQKIEILTNSSELRQKMAEVVGGKSLLREINHSTTARSQSYKTLISSFFRFSLLSLSVCRTG